MFDGALGAQLFGDSGPPAWARAIGAPANARAVYDFANQRYWKAPFSFARASQAWAEDNSDVYSSFASDVPRIRAVKGIKLEIASTNSDRNNSGVGAVPGTPGTPPTNESWASPLAGLARTVLAPTTVNGIDFEGVRYSGTTNAAAAQLSFEMNQGIAAALGDTWSASAIWYIIINSGLTPTLKLYISERDSAGTSLASWVSGFLAIGSSPQRQNYSHALNNASVQYVTHGALFTFTNGGAYNFDFYHAPQMEKTAAATSYMKTSGTAATRAADALTLKLGSATQNLTLTFDDASTQTINGVSGDTLLNPANLNRPDVTKGWSVAA